MFDADDKRILELGLVGFASSINFNQWQTEAWVRHSFQNDPDIPGFYHDSSILNEKWIVLKKKEIHMHALLYCVKSRTISRKNL